MAVVSSLIGGSPTLGTLSDGRAAVVGGSFALTVQTTVGGAALTTGTIAYNATAAQVKTAIEALGGITVDVDCAVGKAPCLEAADHAGFKIDEAEVIYWGTCPTCLAKV
jgi:Fe2+ or Zn2+ uptake regulation protein